MMVGGSEERLRIWERRTRIPLLVAALLFVLAWSWPMIDPGLPGWLIAACNVFAGATWVMVAVDYLVRVCLAENRRRYIKANIFGLIIVIFPAMGSLQIVKLLTVVSALKTRVSVRLRKRVATYAIGGSLLLIWFGGITVLSAERGVAGSNISTLGDALWWALVTTTTVGYGDHYPVTTGGRLIAAVLLICGIALVGAVTAMLTSWIVDTVAESTEDPSVALHKEMSELRAELASLRIQIATTVTHRPASDE